jgi:formiminotetrahydrofolate cyclodeaminase
VGKCTRPAMSIRINSNGGIPVKKLVEMSIEDFLEQLSSDCPTPGGGSVAALEGAFGAALVEMVARLTIGREKFMEHEALMNEAMGKAYRLRVDLTELVDMDTDAYNNVTSAYKLPKSTDEEKAERSAAIQAALKMATNIPAETMEKARLCLEVANIIKGKVNPSCNSDLEVAQMSLKAAADGAWKNVLANLSGIRDESFIEDTKLRCRMRVI